MKRVLGCGLVLLAAAGAGTRCAVALGGAGTGYYFIGSGGGAPTHAGAQGYLGVDVRDVSDDELAALKLKESHGAEIVLVDHDAPAGKAGLREHDVVLQMNGQAVEGEDQIRKMLRECAPGRTVVLVISRDGQQMTVTTQMANREALERQAWEQHIVVPEPQYPAATTEDSYAGYGSAAGPATAAAPAVRGGNGFLGAGLLMNSSYTGAMLEVLSTQLADFFGVAAGHGLLVRSVVPNSPAALSGLRAGDVVIKADTKPVTSTADWAKVIKTSHGKPVSVVVMREKRETVLTLTPDGKKRSSVDGQERPVVARLGLSWIPRL